MSAEEERVFWDQVDPAVDYKECIFEGPEEHGLARLTAELDSGASVFDLGCGTGRLALRYATRTFGGVDGFDIAPRLLEAARRARDYGKCRNRPVTFVQTDGRSIPAPDETYGGGWSVLLFQHLEPETVRGYLAEVERVLRPGGRFVFQFAYDPDGSDAPYSWNHSLNDMSIAALDVGLAKDSDVEPDELYPTWYWLTVEKP